LYSNALSIGCSAKVNVSALMNRSTAYFASCFWQKCIDDCESLLSEMSLLSLSQRIKIYARRGGCFLRISELELDPACLLQKALTDYEMVRCLSAEDPTSSGQLKKRFLQDYKQIKELFEGVPKGKFHFENGNFGEAAKDFEEISKITVLECRNLVNASTSYLQILDLEKTRQFAKLCLEKTSDSKLQNQCFVNLAICELFEGNVAKGKKMLEDLLESIEDKDLEAVLLKELLKLEKFVEEKS